MKKVTALFFLAILFCGFSPAKQQVLFSKRAAAISVPYVGPGDVKSTGAFAFGSCATAYTSAFAATLGAICDVVDTSTGLTTCTFHIQASGFVNPSECNATACATACSITKVYDQTGNAHHWTQATLSAMPLVEFSALNGLPGMKCASTATTCVLATSNVSISQPINLYMVAKRQGAFTTAQGFLGGSNAATTAFLGYTTSTNTTGLTDNSVTLTATASDGAYHVIQGLANGTGTSSAINVDGTDATGATSTTGLSAEALRIHRSGNQSQGTEMEVYVAAGTAFSATDRNSLSSNAHSRYAF